MIGVPPIGFSDLAGSRHATASAFFLEKLEGDEDVGDDEMALLIVRPNGDLVFVSAEMPKVDLIEGDRVLRVLRRKSTLAVA